MAIASMQAMAIPRHGGPHVLDQVEVPVPRPAAGEVLVRVRACSVSRLDLSIRKGWLAPPRLPHVLGTELVGEIVIAGPGVSDWAAGDRVIAIGEDLGRNRPGGYAEYATVAAGDLHLIPAQLSFTAAASVGSSFPAAWTALLKAATFRQESRERTVVIGAAEPTGTAAVQIARWKKSTVVAVADGHHARRLTALGAARVISHSASDLADRVDKALAGRGATVVINVTGARLEESLAMLAAGGRLVFTSPGQTQPLDVGRLVDRRAIIVGSSAEVDGADVQHVFKLFGEGTFIPVIDSVLPLSRASHAHQLAASASVFGNVILVPDRFFQSDE